MQFSLISCKNDAAEKDLNKLKSNLFNSAQET